MELTRSVTLLRSASSEPSTSVAVYKINSTYFNGFQCQVRLFWQLINYVYVNFWQSNCCQHLSVAKYPEKAKFWKNITKIKIFRRPLYQCCVQMHIIFIYSENSMNTWQQRSKRWYSTHFWDHLENITDCSNYKSDPLSQNFTESHAQRSINQPHTGLTVDSSEMTFLPTSKSRDTKTRPNIKNPALINLDIVP